MEQDKTVRQLNGPPNNPNSKGPSPSRSFGDLYHRVVAANRKFYKGKIPPDVMTLIHQYTEAKYGMMYGMGQWSQDDMVLKVGDDPVQKAQGIPDVGTGQGQDKPLK